MGTTSAISGGGSNLSAGADGATAPIYATEIGVIDNSGKLQGVSASNPIRVDPTGTTIQPVSGTFTPGLPPTAATTLTNGNTSSSGWTSIVAGVSAKTTRLWRVIVSANAATNIEFGDGTTVFLGPYYLQAGGSIVLDISGEPWYVTAAAAALEINSSNAVAITYSTWTTQS